MELAALRTRQAKHPRERAALFKAWQAEAKALGFNLTKARQQAHNDKPLAQASTHKPITTKSASALRKTLPSTRQMLSSIASLARGSSQMPGLGVRLSQRPPRPAKDREQERS